MKMLSQDIEQEDHDKEVEGIESPAQKTSRNRMPGLERWRSWTFVIVRSAMVLLNGMQ
jgi:hypothetical protein